MTSTRTVLVLGATGGVGGEIARQMRAAGWDVRAMKRGLPQQGGRRDGIGWVAGDAMNRAHVSAAAKGASVIVHAVNPPGYQNWAQLVLPMLDNTVAAATAAGATVVLPGTIYNYGPDAFPVLGEASPQHPETRKGAIRVAMEQRLQDYAGRGGRVLIVRAGDFFGPVPGNNWFSQGLVKTGRPVTKIYRPGDAGVGHAWSYLPDVARIVVELLEKDPTAFESFATFHMRGHWDVDGTQMTDAIRRVVLRRTGVSPRVTAFPWWLMALASPFVTTLREMREMRYLWRNPLRMDNTRLVSVLGREPHTPLEEAVEATLEGLGCLSAAAPSRNGSGSTALRGGQ